MIGRRIGSWILERELGRGGMGSVFEARHVSLRTHAAVKVLSPGLESEDAFRQRFHREADLQAQLRHSNIVRVLDYLEDDGQWFLVVEYVDGGSLADLLARGEKPPRAQILAWMRQSLAGLGHAHERGIVHRDIKPANLLLGGNGEIVVADFGIARADNSPGLTSTGMVIGTPQYMSPEQILTPDKIDGRADVYSLGIVLYELLLGRKPFDAGSQFAVLQAQVSDPPPPMQPIDPSITPELEAVVMRALAKKPADRYADCAAMIRDLDRVAHGPARDGTLAVSPQVPLGGTVHSGLLYEKAAAESPDGLSAGELRDRRRRTFLRRMAASTAAIVVLAVLLAFQLAKGQDASFRPETTTTSDTASTTMGSGSETDTQTTTGATVEDPKPPILPDHGSPMFEDRKPLEKVKNELSVDPPPQTPVFQQALVPVARPVPVLPERPQIAVIGMGGDPLMAGALEQEMERRMVSYDVVDEHGDPDVAELVERKGAEVSQKTLGAALLRSGFHVLILLRVEEADKRTLRFGGQEGTVRAARLRLNAYLLPANKTLGRGWTELVEYVELSTEAKARQAFIGPTADLRKAINDEWAALRIAAAGAPAH